eukprot:11426702-Alexandrium_andersonii.AAC.1
MAFAKKTQDGAASTPLASLVSGKAVSILSEFDALLASAEWAEFVTEDGPMLMVPGLLALGLENILHNAAGYFR